MIAVPKTAEFPPLKQMHAGALTVGYAEVGPTGGKPVLPFHGWPYDIHLPQEAPQAVADAIIEVDRD
jgi:pimeloyl-ACP methyl ester carboxylesterase